MITERLRELGYEYTPAPEKVPGFPIRSAVRIGNLVFTSGQGPIHDGSRIIGQVGAEVDIKQAKQGAEFCAFNCLRAAGSVVDVDSIKRVVKLVGLVNCADEFHNTSEVVNGASEFFESILGDQGISARTAVGARLPSNISVEVEAVFEVE